MGIIAWIILGLLAGLIAKALLPGEDPGGIIITTLLGVAGALIGGFIVKALGFGDPIDEFFDISTWLGAIAIGTLCETNAASFAACAAPARSSPSARALAPALMAAPPRRPGCRPGRCTRA